MAVTLFDQIRFYPVSAEELLQMRADFPSGKFKLKIEEDTFSLSAYNAFLAKEAQSINAFKADQQRAFEAERARWIASGQAHYSQEVEISVTDQMSLKFLWVIVQCQPMLRAIYGK